MLKELQLTVYDVFGYLWPGAMVLVVVALLYWTLACPGAPVALTCPRTDTVIALLLIAYTLGHVWQACSCLLMKRLLGGDTSGLCKGRYRELPEQFAYAAREKIARKHGAAVTLLPDKALYELCDEIVIQSGATQEREMYVHREGFYRGMCTASAALANVLILRAIAGPVVITLAKAPVVIGRCTMLSLALGSALSSLLLFSRYKIFARFRVVRAVIGAFVLTGDPNKPQAASTDAAAS